MSSIDIIRKDHSYALDPSCLSGPVIVPAGLLFCDDVSSSGVGLNSQDAVQTGEEENVRIRWPDTSTEWLSCPESTVETTNGENPLDGTGTDVVDEHFAR
jgi:hypothetical protein